MLAVAATPAAAGRELTPLCNNSLAMEPAMWGAAGAGSWLQPWATSGIPLAAGPIPPPSLTSSICMHYANKPTVCCTNETLLVVNATFAAARDVLATAQAAVDDQQTFAAAMVEEVGCCGCNVTPCCIHCGELLLFFTTLIVSPFALPDRSPPRQRRFLLRSTFADLAWPDCLRPTFIPPHPSLLTSSPPHLTSSHLTQLVAIYH